MVNKIAVLWLIISVIPVSVCRESVWNIAIDQRAAGSFLPFPNYLYEDSFVATYMLCNSQDKNLLLTVTWIVVEMNCMHDMYNFQPEKQLSILPVITSQQALSLAPVWGGRRDLESLPEDLSYTLVYFQPSLNAHYPCGDNHFLTLKDESNASYYVAAIPDTYRKNGSDGLHLWRIPRDNTSHTKEVANHLTKVWHTGMYHFLLSVLPFSNNSDFTITGRVEMRSKWGYLPAIIWPLLPYSGAMAVLYLILGTAWVVIWVKTQEHTTKIHVVIGGVTVAGGMANTLLFVEENAANSNGTGFLGLDWASSILGFIQGGLTTVLLLVVSTGYGINRPSLHRKLVAGFILLAVLRVITNLALLVVTDEKLRIQYTAPIVSFITSACYGIVVLLIGAIIMVFSILTFLHLWRRRHSQQILMFSVFMVLCILIFIVEVFLIGTSYGWFSACRKDWRYEWLFNNFGNMMTLPLLVALMWLWRPVDVAQSYAFFPLDSNDKMPNEEEDDNEELSETQILNNNKGVFMEELT